MDVLSLAWTTGVSFAIVVCLAPILIPLLQRFKFGQAIRSDGPMRHLQKQGTPTMGGVMIILATAFTAWRFSNSPSTWMMILALAGFGVIGLLDDGLKILRKRNLGLTAKQKLVLQVLVSVIFYLALYAYGWHFQLQLPFIAQPVNLGIFYLPILVFFMVGFSNAVNITDGLDGLVSGIAAIAFAAFAFLAWWNSQWNVSVFAMAVVGSLLGFLIFNRHPARVFMGDTGSLALGGALAAVSILTRTEFWLLLIGGVFVLEVLSVIIQVFSFQTFGRRVFKMSPIHHHFELVGWSEWKVVTVFWGTTALLSIVALGLYLRG